MATKAEQVEEQLKVKRFKIQYPVSIAARCVPPVAAWCVPLVCTGSGPLDPPLADRLRGVAGGFNQADDDRLAAGLRSSGTSFLRLRCR